MNNTPRILPQTRWSASSLWAVEWSPLAVLMASLAVFGVGEGFLLRSNLGAAPWTVLSQGVALQADFSVGWASFLISCVIMLMWLPLKLKAGLGTILNIVVIALFLGLTAALLQTPESLFGRLSFALFGTLLIGMGSAFYLTCHQGAGPRDGLMVGLCQRFGLNVGTVRTLMEIGVCALGFYLGGTVGVGTLLFALSVGWVLQGILSLIANAVAQKG